MSNTRNVIVTTTHKGVFYGQTANTTKASDPLVKLKNAKMAIYWGTTKGIFELADTGPTAESRISAPADVELVDVTAVIDVTDAAAKVWADA